MRFNPKSENELNSFGLLEDGEYDFAVNAAEDKLSKAGKEMIELKLIVWDKNGKDRFIFDYLLEAMAFKLRHFCEAMGLEKEYDAGEIKAEHCVGKSGKVLIGVQKGNAKPEGGTYPDKNQVKDYIKSEIKPVEKKDDFISDDVPF